MNPPNGIGRILTGREDPEWTIFLLDYSLMGLFKQFWIPAFAGMTKQAALAIGSSTFQRDARR
jgi:hypothetical protein